jgi:phage FluMu gp28-like protein
MPTITIPHQFSPRPYQLDFLKSSARYKIAVWNRRAGKSKTVLNDQIRKAQLKKGIYYYFLPTYKLARQVIWDSLINEHCPNEIVSKKNDSEPAIYYKNGSIQRFLGSEDPDKHRGVNPIDVVFDEYSEISEELWTAIIQPVLSENKGTATFIFTPKGKNHAWKLIQQQKANPNWFISVKNVHDTKSHDDEEIAEVKRNTPEALFKQEYECEFMEGAGAFFRRIKDNITPNINLSEQGAFQLGVDLAKYQDWTVITPLNLNTFTAYPQDRFNQIDWNLQKARIEASTRKHGNAKIVVDSTGVGDPIAEDLIKQGLNVEAFKFTETSRRQLLDNLAILLEQDFLKIPNDPGLIDELESFQYSLTDKGKIKVAVPDGTTDDRVMSLALACWGAKRISIQGSPIYSPIFDLA